MIENQLLTLTDAQRAFIIILPISIVLLAFLVVLFILLRKRQKKTFPELCYKKINNIVMYHDYFLINQFPIKLEDHQKTFIDHIICANKYIYIVSDFYLDGDLKGFATDESLILIGKNGKKTYIDNPIQYNKKLLTRLAIMAGFDLSLLKGICLVNDGCLLNIKKNSNQFYITNKKNLNKLIKISEKDDVSSINQVQLEQAVRTLSKIKNRK